MVGRKSRSLNGADFSLWTNRHWLGDSISENLGIFENCFWNELNASNQISSVKISVLLNVYVKLMVCDAV